MADASTPAPVFGPRPFNLSGTDQRGAMMTVSILFIVYAFLIVAMRVATKYRSLALDDWLVITAMILALAQLIGNIVAVDSGFGARYSLSSQSHHNTIASTKALRASDVFFLLSLFVSKASIIWLCRRLFFIGHNKTHKLWEGMIGACGVWCFGSILAINIGCTGLQTIRAGQSGCSGIVARWSVVGALDALTEVALYGFSIMAVLPLQMSWSRKFQASACFALRIPLIAFIILHVKFLSNFNSAQNRSVALTKVQIFRECEMIYSLLSASIPALNQYLRKFNTQDATQFRYNLSRYNGGSGGSGVRSLPLKSLSKNKSKRSQKGSWNASSNDNGIQDCLGKSSSYKVLVETQSGAAQDGVSNASHEDGSFGRHNSEDHIIRKDVQYEVRHED